MFEVDYYFDFLSPYSYLSWKWFYKHKNELSEYANFNFTPVILAQVIHAQKTLGPAEIAPKREYLMRDCLRVAASAGVDFNPPPLPFNSLYGLRISLKECCAEKQVEVINLFFDAAWGKGIDLGISEEVEKLLEGAGHPAQQWMELVGDRVIRAELKKNTKKAINAGVFGLPSFIVREQGKDSGELFWGNDSVGHLLNYFKGEDPFSPLPTNESYGAFQEKLKNFQTQYLTSENTNE